ncbi:hypothetical protein COLO4_16166 [Corchorus olitorius]|uniref:Uncharacterized protein n=1 Tax=Corchorus olitorius TaxID=93759 RepID=A0A1R3JIZ9_9ROSI|nr:hypothetical protein COLO4_16166 [Corchorus olitorius]
METIKFQKHQPNWNVPLVVLPPVSPRESGSQFPVHRNFERASGLLAWVVPKIPSRLTVLGVKRSVDWFLDFSQLGSVSPMIRHGVDGELCSCSDGGRCSTLFPVFSKLGQGKTLWKKKREVWALSHKRRTSIMPI